MHIVYAWDDAAYAAKWHRALEEFNQALLTSDGALDFTLSTDMCQLALGIVDKHFFGCWLLKALAAAGRPIQCVVYSNRSGTACYLAVTHTAGWPLPEKGWRVVRDGVLSEPIFHDSYPTNTIFVHVSALDGLDKYVNMPDLPAVWLSDGVKVTSKAEALLHLVAHEAIHALLHVIPQTQTEASSAQQQSFHSPSFMCIARGVLGHPMVGPANAHESMQLCTLPEIVNAPDRTTSMRCLWHLNGNAMLFTEYEYLEELAKLRRRYAGAP